MDETQNRGYPYPQCEPPLIEDAGDLPAGLKALALAVDTDVAALNTSVASVLNPPGGLLQLLAGPEALAAGASFTKLNTALFNNGGVANLPANSRLTISVPGLYFLSATITTAAAVSATDHQIWITVNGVIVIIDSIKPGPAGTEAMNTAFGMTMLAAGDLVRLAQSFPGGGTESYTYAALGAVLVRELP